MALQLDSVTKQISDLIESRILCKQYPAGSQIPTRQIAEENDVSLMPVRLALRELAESGLVVNRARVGFFVVDFSIDELLDISATRRMFETYCLRTYFDRLDRDTFRDIYEELLRNGRASFDEALYKKKDVQLHELFISASGNDFLQQTYNRVKRVFAVCMYYDSNNIEHHILSQDDHIRIARAILQNDREKALVELNRHFDMVDNTIRSDGRIS